MLIAVHIQIHAAPTNQRESTVGREDQHLEGRMNANDNEVVHPPPETPRVVTHGSDPSEETGMYIYLAPNFLFGGTRNFACTMALTHPKESK